MIKTNKTLTPSVLLITCLLFCLFASPPARADDDLLRRARALQEAGKAQQAYELIQPHIDEYAGNPDFDYLLGQIAIDTGRPQDAVFALQRVLDQKPDFAPARAELGRAYFLIGENEAAKAEFERVQRSQMPDASRALIGRYLSTIDERILGSFSKSTFYITAGAGYDSNVNSATSTSQIALPTGTLTLSSTEADSPVGMLQAGGQFSHALKSNLNVYGSADLLAYETFQEKDFSTQTGDGVIGLHFLHGVNQYRLALTGQAFALDTRSYRNLLGLSGQWLHSFDAANQFTLFGQYAAIRFPDAERLDVNQLSVGATWLHVFASSYVPVGYITGYYGSEDEQTGIANSEFVGRDYYGLRAGIRFKTSARLLWSGVLAYQKSEYGGKYPLFNKVRKDDFINLTLGADYVYIGGWSLRPEIIYSNNASEVELFSYDRLRAMVTVRKEF